MLSWHRGAFRPCCRGTNGADVPFRSADRSMGQLQCHGPRPPGCQAETSWRRWCCNLSCDAAHITLWTTAHRSPKDAAGRRRFRLVKDCDFITNLGHRTRDGGRSRDLGHRGNGPQWLVTDLGLFDFDADGHMRLTALYPDTSAEDVFENTEFAPKVAAKIDTMPAPDRPVVELIRRLDPLKVHEKEIRVEDRRRGFEIT